MTDRGKYERRGVSSGKEEVHRAVEGLQPGLVPGAFCKVLPDLLGAREDRALVMHADGVGTKGVLAYLVWRETGSVDVFAGLAQDAAVMNIDDMLCVGATGPFVLADTIGRNKALIPGEVIKAVIQGFQRFADRLTGLGVPVVLAGGETADVGDAVRTIIVDAVCAAVLPRDRIISAGLIKPGDLIVGLASFGKAKYESMYNSGIGCNGLTSARHDLLNSVYAEKYPETVCPQTPQEFLYSGPYRTIDPLPGSDITVGEALLSPTRTYAPILLEVLAEGRSLIHGLVHCTGGGQTKCIRFGRSVRYVKDNLFDPPPVFSAIKQASRVSWKEMFEVFNMGHRLEIFTNAEGAALVQEKAAKWDVEARIIGRVERSDGPNELFIESPGGLLSWRAAPSA